MPSGDERTIGLRVFHKELAEAVTAEFGTRCPCCGDAMLHGRPRKKNATAQNRRDRASVAHDVPVSMGGNPALWLWACRGCNSDQGAMSFLSWSCRLALDGDGRAERVGRLAAFIEAWTAAHGVPRRFSRRGNRA